jgi:hypothetical protein
MKIWNGLLICTSTLVKTSTLPKFIQLYTNFLGKSLLAQLTYSSKQSHQVKIKVKLSCHRHARDKGERRYIAPTHSWPQHQIGVSGERHVPAALYAHERTPDTHCIGGWVGPIAGLDTEDRAKILCLCWDRTPFSLQKPTGHSYFSTYLYPITI